MHARLDGSAVVLEPPAMPGMLGNARLSCRRTISSNPSPSSGESCKPIILVQLGDSRLRAVISSGKAQHLDAQVGILGNQLAVCDRDAPHSLIVGGGSPVPGGRMARGQQPRPGEQLLAQGAGEVVTFVDARSCRIGTTRSTKFSSPSGVTMRLRLKPSISVSSTHEIRSSAISSAEPTTAGLRLPSPIRLTIRRSVQGSVLNVVSVSTSELIASFFT